MVILGPLGPSSIAVCFAGRLASHGVDIKMENDVVFVIRHEDLGRAVKEIQANRGYYSKTDLVYVLVSACAATFRATGTESGCPVRGITSGTAQLPIAVLDRIVKMRSADDLEIRIAKGVVVCGKATIRHEAITLGKIPDLSVSMPIDPSYFELIVIGRIMGEAGAAEQGLQSRLVEARREMRSDISKAAGILADYRVAESDIELLVEKKMRDAEPSIKKGLSA